jgi:branched-subunit amino acid ABC-type transport system permease component
VWLRVRAIANECKITQRVLVVVVVVVVVGCLYIFFFRFDVGSKNAILLHDIEIGKLFGADFEKIKSIARAETTVAKIHSSTVTLPPLHLLYTR